MREREVPGDVRLPADREAGRRVRQRLLLGRVEPGGVLRIARTHEQQFRPRDRPGDPQKRAGNEVEALEVHLAAHKHEDEIRRGDPELRAECGQIGGLVPARIKQIQPAAEAAGFLQSV